MHSHTSTDTEAANVLITLSRGAIGNNASTDSQINEASVRIASEQNTSQDSDASTDTVPITSSEYTSSSCSSGTSDSSSSSSKAGTTDSETDNESHSQSSTSNSEGDTSSTKNTAAQNKDSESESELPLLKLKDKLNTSDGQIKLKRKMEFVSKHHGLKKFKRERNFKCKLCDFCGCSQKELNEHFLSNHGLLTCEVFGKKYNTLSGYRMHLYEHSDKERTKPCEDCGKTFVFESHRKSHRKVHLTALEHMCMKCPKVFKSKGELTKHQAIHSGKVWSCSKCTYTCKDQRNLRANEHLHGDNSRYICEKCAKGFNHYQQIKRHKIKGNCAAPKA